MRWEGSSMSDERNYTVRIHDDRDGMYWAEVLELPGCFASGANEAELLEALAEAVGFYLSDGDHEVRLMWGPAQACVIKERQILVG